MLKTSKKVPKPSNVRVRGKAVQEQLEAGSTGTRTAQLGRGEFNYEQREKG